MSWFGHLVRHASSLPLRCNPTWKENTGVSLTLPFRERPVSNYTELSIPVLLCILTEPALLGCSSFDPNIPVGISEGQCLSLGRCGSRLRLRATSLLGLVHQLCRSKKACSHLRALPGAPTRSFGSRAKSTLKSTQDFVHLQYVPQELGGQPRGCLLPVTCR